MTETPTPEAALKICHAQLSELTDEAQRLSADRAEFQKRIDATAAARAHRAETREAFGRAQAESLRGTGSPDALEAAEKANSVSELACADIERAADIARGALGHTDSRLTTLSTLISAKGAELLGAKYEAAKAEAASYAAAYDRAVNEMKFASSTIAAITQLSSKLFDPSKGRPPFASDAMIEAAEIPKFPLLQGGGDFWYARGSRTQAYAAALERYEAEFKRSGIL